MNNAGAEQETKAAADITDDEWDRSSPDAASFVVGHAVVVDGGQTGL